MLHCKSLSLHNDVHSSMQVTTGGVGTRLLIIIAPSVVFYAESIAGSYWKQPLTEI